MPQFLPFEATSAAGDPNFPDHLPVSGGGGGVSPSPQVLQQLGADLSATERDSGGTFIAGTSATYTWVAPTDVNSIFVLMASAGSSGAGASNGNVGGSAGAVWMGWITIVPGQTYTILVGNSSIHSGGNNNIHQPGGNTSIAGSATALIDGQGNATIACQAATQTGNAGTTGNVVYTNYAPITGSTALPLDIDHLTNSVRTFAFNPAEGRLTAAEFNSSYFIQGNVGREGGQNILTRATDISSTSNGGGGGAGFVRPTHIQNGRGMAGGRGGIRILWYSNDQFAVNHPLVLQP